MIQTHQFFKVIFFWIIWSLSHPILAQTPHPQARMSAGELQLALKKMQVLGSVLYIAAHPDDENTRLISYLSKEELARTAYLALTRGDGGQNLIGSEIGYELGLIRTQELLAARRVDGATQYFSRANDFGFSKNSGEALSIWDKEKVLADVVWIIRRFRPDVIMTRFSPDRDGKTHGHHTSSAKLALEAFRMAGDSTQFPEQLQDVKTWQPTRIFWNTSWWFYQGKQKFDTTGLIQIDAGKYNNLLGKSYGEIAAQSRTMHKSQGMGTAPNMGKETEYLRLLDGKKANTHIFEGIKKTWRRVEGAAKIAVLLDKANHEFDTENPAKILPILCETYQQIEALQKTNSDTWLEVKKQNLKEIIRNCAGLWFDVTADDFSFVAGDSMTLKIRAVNPFEMPIKLNYSKITFAENTPKIQRDSLLKSNVPMLIEEQIKLKSDLEISQPYWLKNTSAKGMFIVPESDQNLRGLAENPPQLIAELTFEIHGLPLIFRTPLLFRKTDKVRGELYEQVKILPRMTANIQEKNLIFSDSHSKNITILVKSNQAHARTKLTLDLPKGWKANPTEQFLHFQNKYDEKIVTFEIQPSKNQEDVTLSIRLDDQQAQHLTRIEYDHIPPQTVLMPAQIRAVKLEVKTIRKNIGYYVGAGDEIPESLRQIGYEITELTDDNFEAQDLKKFDAIITGIRAYNSRQRIMFHQKKMHEYVRNGGTMIVQFNTTWGRVQGAYDSLIAPYPLKISRDRVTVEEAEVRILDKKHKLINYPNKITFQDFEGWIQERGVYFPNEWDKNYTPILSSNDPNEPPKDGGLLVAHYGKGAFIYTGYAFFRQLPAGVAGAYRLFVNMIEYSE